MVRLSERNYEINWYDLRRTPSMYSSGWKIEERSIFIFPGGLCKKMWRNPVQLMHRLRRPVWHRHWFFSSWPSYWLVCIIWWKRMSSKVQKSVFSIHFILLFMDLDLSVISKKYYCYYYSPDMSFREKYRTYESILKAENGVHAGSRAPLLTSCFL